MAVLGQPFLGNRSAAVTPVTVGGKVFTFFVLIVGLRGVAVPTGLFASALSKARARGRSGSFAPGICRGVC